MDAERLGVDICGLGAAVKASQDNAPAAVARRAREHFMVGLQRSKMNDASTQIRGNHKDPFVGNQYGRRPEGEERYEGRCHDASHRHKLHALVPVHVSNAWFVD